MLPTFFITHLFLAFSDIMFRFVSFPGFVLLALESENPFYCICSLHFLVWDLTALCRLHTSPLATGRCGHV